MSEMNREEIEAALAVRQESGAAMEPALVDSMARKIEATVRRRYEAEVAERKRSEVAATSGQGARVAVAIVSLVMGIPLTAIAGSLAGFPGILLIWVGIVAVNMALAMRRPPHR